MQEVATINTILNELRDLSFKLATLSDQIEELREGQEELREAISNLSLPGADYEVSEL